METEKDKKDIQSLIKWHLTEEKKEYSRDREILIILLGGTASVISIILETYIFSALLIIATVVFVYIGRQKPKTLLFDITTAGVFLENDFLPKENICSFNIIDDPGERARLLLRVRKGIEVNEIIPVYDTAMERIESALKEINIPKDETLERSFLDYIALFI